MTQQTISSNELFKRLEAYKRAAKFLASSDRLSDIQQMENILTNLHQFRNKYPEQEPLITQTLFDIFDHSYYYSPEYMRLRTQVSVICGFASKPTNNMAILNQLMDRMALVDKPENMLYGFKSIAQRTIDLYELGNYREKDPNTKTAYRLRMMLHIINDSLKRKTNPDIKWLHENAHRLAESQPAFKKFAESFQRANQPKKTQKLFPKEAVDAFPAKASMRRRIFSHSYE